MISVSKAEGEPMELQCTAEWPPDSREAIQLGERFMSSRIFKRSARAFRAPRIARQRMLPPPEYPRIPNRDRVAKSPQMKHLKRLVQRFPDRYSHTTNTWFAAHDHQRRKVSTRKPRKIISKLTEIAAALAPGARKLWKTMEMLLVFRALIL